MKHFFLTFSFCLCGLLVMPNVYADEDCDMTLREARSAYSSGEYQRAKKLFDYVVTVCGGEYGDAATWSDKCQNALTPKLTVSRSNISVGAGSGTTSVTVSGNRTWTLNNTNSSLFTATKNGDKITINYTANPNTSSRSDYFDVVATDNSKSVRVYINQSAKAVTVTPSLSVSQYSISTSYYGTTEYLTVTSNTTWEIEYPSAAMYSVTRNGNTLTVKINENTSTESRTDFFRVKTTDGTITKKISLSQTGKTQTEPYAVIDNITVDHNVYQNGQKGMRIHVKFTAYNVYNHIIKPCVFFYFEGGEYTVSGASGTDYVTPDGQATVQSSQTANYTNTTWEDYTLFMPYYYLYLSSISGTTSLEGQVGIRDKTINKWLTPKYTKFYFTYTN